MGKPFPQLPSPNLVIFLPNRLVYNIHNLFWSQQFTVGRHVGTFIQTAVYVWSFAVFFIQMIK